MGAKALSRWRASGAHLLACVAIAAGLIVPLLALWYPRPLFEAAGGNHLLFILLGAYLTLGPLLTLVVFKSGKRGMQFDLAVIGLLQVAALAYGCYLVALARPAFIVFVKDRFEVVSAAELDPVELAAAKYPEFRAAPWDGPRLAAADLPVASAEQQQLVKLAMAGLDLQHFPRYYAPYAARTKQVLAKADRIAELRSSDPVTAQAVDAWLASSGTREDEVRALLLRARVAWVAVLVDPKTAQPVKLILGERIN